MKIIRAFIAISGVILMGHNLAAQPGCMDKSYHAYRNDVPRCGCHQQDHKRLEYVECYCPCSRYPYLDKYGRCLQCGHYREPVEFPITRKGISCQ